MKGILSMGRGVSDVVVGMRLSTNQKMCGENRLGTNP
jgi:hypothetical protein